VVKNNITKKLSLSIKSFKNFAVYNKENIFELFSSDHCQIQKLFVYCLYRKVEQRILDRNKAKKKNEFAIDI